MVAGASKYKPTLDSSLTLDGLRIIYHRNQSGSRRKIGVRCQVSGFRNDQFQKLEASGLGS